jgi:hypothetical protein
MGLSDLASVGSFVSGVAVLVSLIYLALQVRQAERNQRALMQQGRANRVSDSCMRMAEPGLSLIFSKGRDGDESLTLEQLDQYMNICRAAFLSGEDSFLHHLTGQLDEAAYRSFVTGIRSLFRMPGVRAAWRLSSHQYGDEFVQFMDGLMKETRAAAESDRLGQWIEAVQSEKSAMASHNAPR